MAEAATKQPPQEPMVKRLKRRLAQMKTDRAAFESTWMDVERLIAPGTARSLRAQSHQPSARNIASQHNDTLTGSPGRALETLSAGMSSGNTSPARPWFRLTTPEPQLAELSGVKLWLFAVETRMREVFSRSNFYRVMPTLYRDVGAYGTGCVLAFDDDEDMVRFQHLEVGSYWLAQNNRGIVDTCYREFTQTVRQLVEEFGLEQCSERVRNMFANGQLESWIEVCHAIEPNTERLAGVGGRRLRYRSCYWEKAGGDERPLATRYFTANRVLGPRWTVSGDGVYGTNSPAMTALGDVKELNHKILKKAQALDKVVDPPLTGPTSLRNQKVSLLPGKITYVDNVQQGGGLRPIHDWRPDINAIAADIEATRREIREAFFVDLFLMMQQDTRSNITAREIQERHEEKLLMLGPVVERLNTELLEPCIDLVFDLLVQQSEPYWRGVLKGEPPLPPPPAELENVELKVEFISVLAQAQKAVGIAAMDNLANFVGALAQMAPTALDKLDFDQMIDERAEMLGVSPRIVRSDDDVAALRSAQAEQAQQAKQMQQMAAMGQVARDVGSVKGDSAVAQALQLAGAGPIASMAGAAQ